MATVYAVLAAIAVFPHIVHSAEPARVTYDRLDGIQHNTTALHDIRAPAWVNNAELRGTASILFSCILTLFACIYKALHLNIPNEGAGFFWQLIGKVKWMLIALFAPEMTVWVALDQFLTAWELSRYLTAKDEQRSPTCAFDLKYGFFVVMGGLQMPKEAGKSRILSASGTMWLADHGELLHISRSQILDRSKADTVQKALVMFQVGWMALQCIARKAYGLPLCLLEVHTMVHVVCAILMYALWWEVSRHKQMNN
ncbi:hypothetical protein QBC42DRAFT_229635 [Cladorrhinum samala]|uniref:Uncharacterized protein n=1 Tax=Cladorrhinum samala TaxID=585594 RepID=A0AAV9HKI8_9PEZI|nr:hypothetical protein QBC42DRAFT_229635 [Cladorrhinum samala]